MANIIKPKRSGTAATAPTLGQLADGELAINYTDKKYYMRVGGAVVDITPGAGSYVSTGDAFNDAFTSTVLYYNGSGGANNIDVDTLAEGTKVLVNAAGGNTNYPAAGGFWHIETIRAYTGAGHIQRAWRYNYGNVDSYAYRNYNGTSWTTWTIAWDNNTTRHQADFSTASAARAMFQTNVVNGSTFVSALPNGTGTISHFRAYGGSSDPNNAHHIDLYASTTSVFINSAQTGTGVLRDIQFTFLGTEKARISTAGVVSAQSYFDSYGAAAGYRLNDRGGTGNNWSIYTAATTLEFTASYNGAAYSWKCGNTGAFEVDGTAAGYFLNDRTTATRWGIYSTASILRIWSGSVDLVTVDLSGNAIFDGTITQEDTLLVGYKNLYSAVNTWGVGKLNKMTAGVTIGTGNAADTTYYGYNNSAANIVLTQGAGLTLRRSGSATTGNVTILPRGFFTLYCLSTTEYIVSGDTL